MIEGVANADHFDLPPGFGLANAAEDASPVEYAEAVGRSYFSFIRHEHRKSGGQYQTPAAIAKFMARFPSNWESHMRVLDPGSGVGILSAAICEEASVREVVESLHIDAYETDAVLAEITYRVLAFSREWLIARGVDLTFEVKREDFVMAHGATLKAAAKNNGRIWDLDNLGTRYDLVISNPPYFKIGKDDPRAVAGGAIVHGQPNVYALFMAISAELISDVGELVFIVPRSFASGPYFKRFREYFFERVTPKAIHLFDSRKDVFDKQDVLQESLIISAGKRVEEDKNDGRVRVSHSDAAHDLADSRSVNVGIHSILDKRRANREICIPDCLEDLELVERIHGWPNFLHSLGLDISTGPVVPFRAVDLLSHVSSEPIDCPLLWMHHVSPMKVKWPLSRFKKAQWIRQSKESRKLLVANQSYVLLRRFSAKEEKRRLVAAPLLRDHIDSALIGLENHLNYIKGVSRELDDELVFGVAAILNSTYMDRYFRMFNGNTQVNATELRVMPLPSEEDIRMIGTEIRARRESENVLDDIDDVVGRTLNLLPNLNRERVAAAP